jgi:hypothetical protein
MRLVAVIMVVRVVEAIETTIVVDLVNIFDFIRY